MYVVKSSQTLCGPGNRESCPPSCRELAKVVHAWVQGSSKLRVTSVTEIRHKCFKSSLCAKPIQQNFSFPLPLINTHIYTHTGEHIPLPNSYVSRLSTNSTFSIEFDPTSIANLAPIANFELYHIVYFQWTRQSINSVKMKLWLFTENTKILY